MKLYTTLFASPIGPLRVVVGDAGKLVRLDFHGDRAEAGDAIDSWKACATVTRQLDEYFLREREDFELELAPAAGTDFQQAVWRELTRIPYGETISYGELARRIDRPKAVRAVGAANGANPTPIVVPCHRVIAADSKLTGFGGGLPLKRALLEFEGVIAAGDLPFRQAMGAS